MSKALGIFLVALLLVSMGVVVIAVPWDGVPDDSTPAQAIWVDPKSTACLDIGSTFVVDILINITAPTSPGGTGIFGFEYKLSWDPSVIDTDQASSTTHVLPGSGFQVTNDWSVPGQHWYAWTLLSFPSFTGVTSLCTYTFEVVGSGGSLLDLHNTEVTDDTATIVISDANGIGNTVDGVYCGAMVPRFELTVGVVGSGTTVPAPGSYMYDEGTVVSVDAIPDASWMLDHWLLDTVDVGAADPYAVTMDANHTLTAVFVEIPPVPGIPVVIVDPPYPIANPCEYFDVNITVQNCPYILGFQFKLRWRKSILGFPPGPPYAGDNELCNVTEGTFLSSAGGTAFTVLPNYIESYVHVGCHLTSTVATPPSGNGTLVTFRFHVLEAGATNLTLSDVSLYNYTTGGKVPGVTTQNGYFHTTKPFVDFTWTPVSPEVNEAATFNASACWDPDGGSIMNYTWNFGDGNVTVIGDDEPVTPIVIHKFSGYNQTGWQVTLNVTDDESETSSKTSALRMWHEIVVVDIWPSIYIDYDWWFMDTVDRKIIRGEWLWILGTVVNLGTYEEVTNVTLTARHVATGTTVHLPWLWYENETATPWNETNVREPLGTGAAGGSGWDLMFHWHTDTALSGAWELTLAATPVPGEANTANNVLKLSMETLPYGELMPLPHILPLISRDPSLTGQITIQDVQIAAKALGSQAEDNPETPWNETKNWNPLVDFNNDGIITMCDLVVIGVNFGKTW